MGKIRKQWKWMILLLALSVLCASCSDDDGGSNSNTPSNLLTNFHKTPDNEIEARIKALKRLLPEETYNEITKGSRNHPGCVEADNGSVSSPTSSTAGSNADLTLGIRKVRKTAWTICWRLLMPWGWLYPIPSRTIVQNSKISRDVFPTRIRRSAVGRAGEMPTLVAGSAAFQMRTVRMVRRVIKRINPRRAG